MSMGLFANTPSARSKNLVELKAGKMNLQGNLVKPDKRKGLIYVFQSDDTLMHFAWKDRQTGVVEDDLIIFPDDFEYKKITKCTTGRVFLMKLKSCNKKQFFWMQETDAEKDEAAWKKINDAFNNPGGVTSSAGSRSESARSNAVSGLASALGGDFGNLSSSEIQSIFYNDQQMQQLLGLSGWGSSNSPTSNRSASSSNQTSRTQSTAESRAQSAQPSATAAATPASTITATAAKTGLPSADELKALASRVSEETFDLSDAVTLDVMTPILVNKEVQDKLISFLPEGDVLPKNEEELKKTFGTQQFKRAMNSFCEAVQSGQLGPLLHQFNLPNEVSAAASQGNLMEFAKALENHMKSKKGEKQQDQSMDDDSRMDTK